MLTTEATYLIDAGDAFFKRPYIVEAKREHLTAVAEAIVQAYNVMDCQVVNGGTNDLGAGSAVINKLQDQAIFPFISANIMDANSGKAVFESSVIVKTHDRVLGFVGVTSGDKRIKEYTFADPVEAANQAVEAIRDQVDLVFLLANVDDRTETKLTEEVKNIDFLIRSKTGSLYRNPKEKNGVIVVRNGKQGKYACALKITQVDKVAKLKNVSAQNTRIKFADNRLNAMSKDLKQDQTLEERYATDKKRLELIKRLRSEKQTNLDLIKTLKNTYFFEAIPLNDKLADTPEVAEIVAEYIPQKDKAKDKTIAKEKVQTKVREKVSPK